MREKIKQICLKLSKYCLILIGFSLSVIFCNVSYLVTDKNDFNYSNCMHSVANQTIKLI